MRTKNFVIYVVCLVSIGLILPACGSKNDVRHPTSRIVVSENLALLDAVMMYRVQTASDPSNMAVVLENQQQVLTAIGGKSNPKGVRDRVAAMYRFTRQPNGRQVMVSTWQGMSSRVCEEIGHSAKGWVEPPVQISCKMQGDQAGVVTLALPDWKSE